MHYDDHPNDIAMRNYAYKQGAAVYDAVGAIKPSRFRLIHRHITSALVGRARSPGDGVCNKWGQTHDVKNLFISDGSQFTTSGGENPTLTIVTLAIRQADRIAAESTRRNL